MVKTFICRRSPAEQIRDHESPLGPDCMSIRRDLLMRTALLRMPDVLLAARAAAPTTPPQPVPAAAPVRLPVAQPKQRRRTKARTPTL
ncbi:hypothetical protein KPL78_10700 [Roseomonas sp. HJA6]|uniref:Uncharacterized protein n=1 Tax=Roseomonas alba TaxID=2846776 RepID=A0ABS7A7N7_9PROT|nr:hypothetical protein [Neoroseomonas alba]MBW6398319.1 hypothetical protein [Neoroseomonas alba]